MTELEAILLLMITIGNIILLIILGLGYISNKKHKEQVAEYDKLITSYKKTVSVMDANITHLRNTLKEKTENIESTESTEIEESINIEGAVNVNIENSNKDNK